MKTIKAKVHRLPTEEGCIAFEKDYGFKFIGTTKEGYYKTENHQPHHLYFTTDEKIKEGDWIFETDLNTINQAGKDYNFGFGIKHDRKIIATTDLKLIADGVAEIKQSFIEEYCKAGGIDEVLVELEYKRNKLIKNLRKMNLLNIKIYGSKDVVVENTLEEIDSQSDNKWTTLNECYWDSKTTADGYSCISKRRTKRVLTDNIYDITELH